MSHRAVLIISIKAHESYKINIHIITHCNINIRVYGVSNHYIPLILILILAQYLRILISPIFLYLLNHILKYDASPFKKIKSLCIPQCIRILKKHQN